MFDRNVWQKAYREKTANACTKKYEKTPKGFLMRAYRNMKSRIEGIQKAKYHLYEGKGLEFTKEEFYEWALKHPTFLELYNAYIASGYQRKLAPSCDRINPELGYAFSNIEWVTHSENSRRGSVNRRYT